MMMMMMMMMMMIIIIIIIIIIKGFDIIVLGKELSAKNKIQVI
jgi:hypothetical protein